MGTIACAAAITNGEELLRHGRLKGLSIIEQTVELLEAGEVLQSRGFELFGCREQQERSAGLAGLATMAYPSRENIHRGLDDTQVSYFVIKNVRWDSAGILRSFVSCVTPSVPAVLVHADSNLSQNSVISPASRSPGP